MNTVKVRNLELGAGIPAICIPNVGKSQEEIISLTRHYKELPMDLMEWRADWFEDIDNIYNVTEVLTQLREILGDIPLLFTFRTKREGGVHTMNTDTYISLNKSVAATGMADLMDVELFTGDELVTDLISYIHQYNTKVVVSNHDFHKTPAKSDIIYRLRKMQDLGADIPKIAVMPQNKKDVLTLLAATEEMTTDFADRPIITMSMASLGSISRLTCEMFGSCLTFGSGETASAPGQLRAEELHSILQNIHRILL
ncbi:3-dehydroquinate dehydratase [Lachnospiraceae bacterium]|nr:3-dehydroquinate dehydratase [Lachnospiraceae bacterium]